eukprot:c34814_g1_i1 orf=82-636(-)
MHGVDSAAISRRPLVPRLANAFINSIWKVTSKFVMFIPRLVVLQTSRLANTLLSIKQEQKTRQCANAAVLIRRVVVLLAAAIAQDAAKTEMKRHTRLCKSTRLDLLRVHVIARQEPVDASPGNVHARDAGSPLLSTPVKFGRQLKLRDRSYQMDPFEEHKNLVTEQGFQDDTWRQSQSWLHEFD